ncbi:MAG: phenylalanine 4-monooxygenase [Xanthomonadales bacterium]|nr:phenylalanine 4-monooxygenase [Xanthomonadales bacterium]MBK7146528.1 phenylalanine 4-monooxygenase [Xanthomonadales bacterium]MCC6560346.1 phenylalanine 4-monooxygenase [Xanthomonadales bacterium]
MTEPRRVEHQMTDKGYVPVYTTAVVEQPWARYSEADHAVWGQLFRRQREILRDRACPEFLASIDALGMDDAQIPKFDDINRLLLEATGWKLIAVEGLLPELTFFEHLAAREFPVTWWIRRADQIDYIAEPDLFHDLFGHVPLLMNPVFADYMQAYGAGGVRASTFGNEPLANLTRLYWYSVEFGLISTPQGLRIYGAGILSSKGESIHCLESEVPNRIGFDVQRVMQTRYRIDSFQKTYFVIDGFEQLFQATVDPDFGPIYYRMKGAEPIPAATVLDSDRVFQRGSGAGWSNDGDV